MEVICVASLTLVMMAVVGFFVWELPLLGALTTARQKLQEPATRKRFVLLAGFCLALTVYGYWLFGMGRDLCGFLLGTAYLAAITPKDIREHIIPDRTTASFAVWFTLFQISSLDVALIVDAAIGAVLGLVLLGLPYLIRRDSIGLGDVKAVAACGVIYGALGLIHLLLRAFIAIFLYSVVQLLLKRATLKSETPFAPFLFLAVII